MMRICSAITVCRPTFLDGQKPVRLERLPREVLTFADRDPLADRLRRALRLSIGVNIFIAVALVTYLVGG